jgi:hypothetical protein
MTETPQLWQYPPGLLLMRQDHTWLLVSGFLTRFSLAYLVPAVAEL